MDKATVKLILDSYRPQDANDPIFAEALREVAADPELAEWFAETQKFDAVISSKLQGLSVPEDVKHHILLGYHNVPVVAGPRRRRQILWLSSIAAVLTAALLCWSLLPRAKQAPRRSTDALALEAISYTDQMPPLQFVCFDAAAVAGWVNKQPAAQQLGVALPKPDKSLSMAMIGSSVVNWNGRPVVMICLQNGQKMAMLYIVPPDEASDLKEGASTTVQKDNWVVRATKTNGRVQVLTTKGRPEDLDFKSPFLRSSYVG